MLNVDVCCFSISGLCIEWDWIDYFYALFAFNALFSSLYEDTAVFKVKQQQHHYAPAFYIPHRDHEIRDENQRE